ncbi:MAG: DNA/RNA non-specific endonuclease [Acutalibacteraceae bacterium]|nr:DNA/RNA non-specific endonuclease [Acutalibacteraceae bacterium]
MTRLKFIRITLAIVFLLTVCVTGCNKPATDNSNSGSSNVSNNTSVPTENNDAMPKYSGEPFVKLNNNTPVFGDEISPESFEKYSELDDLGRCGVAEACVGIDIMPTEDRGAIGQVKPVGWHTVKYDVVDGKYLYNRCHLIGFQLTGENANTKNLITGTRYFNVDGMLPFENMVADYVKETENHVMYRVTPVYEGDNLIADGVQIEAYSVEDKGEGICFNVFVYNIQPGIVIDYATGESRLEGENSKDNSSSQQSSSQGEKYILNTKSKKIHTPNCGYVQDINAENKSEYQGNIDNLVDQGYTSCKKCNP